MSKNIENEVIVFNDEKLVLEVTISGDSNTIWLTQNQMADLFETSSDNIGLHIKNVFIEDELDNDSTTEVFSVVRKEGTRSVKRNIIHYNLDMIISVGYRVKSKRATYFRKWATNILTDYAIKGYVINQRKIEQNKYLDLIRILEQSSDRVESKQILSILEQYTMGLKLLDDYDHQSILKPEGEEDIYRLTYEECIDLINLMSKKHETDVFGIERGGAFKSSIGAIYQTFDNNELYPTLEEKASHLLYFLVKNHGFVDGNKRIAAAIFVYFLNKNNSLVKNGVQVIDNKILVAITIMIAESNPNDKDLMVNLVMVFLVEK